MPQPDYEEYIREKSHVKINNIKLKCHNTIKFKRAPLIIPALTFQHRDNIDNTSNRNIKFSKFYH